MPGRPSPLQNRVRPDGEIVAVTDRGGWMGNRGGRIHGTDQRLGQRRWASKAWIICVLQHKDWHRAVMGAGYTELFFLDEATALAAGHRPCALCRRPAFLAFAAGWQRAHGLSSPPRAPQIDAVLHRDRLTERRRKRTYRMPLHELPDGAMFLDNGGRQCLKAGGAAFTWAPDGYRLGPIVDEHCVEVLTPRAAVATLRAGYGVQHALLPGRPGDKISVGAGFGGVVAGTART